jgi:hypothetical protein
MSDNKPSKATKSVLGAGAAVVLLWLVTWPVIYGWGPEVAGIVGDSFGAVNALFSGLALCGLVYAIYLQRQEIQIAREDLDRTKDVLVEQQSLTEI